MPSFNYEPPLHYYSIQGKTNNCKIGQFCYCPATLLYILLYQLIDIGACNYYPAKNPIIQINRKAVLHLKPIVL
jgi:hypothetical protein